MSRKLLNASEMGKLGGKRIVEKYGSSHMAAIGAKGRESIMKNDPEFYKRLSQAGVNARKRKQKESKKTPVDKLTDILTGR